MPALQHAGDGLEGVQWVDKVSEISSVLGRYRQYMGAVLLGAYAVVFVLLLPRYRRRAWRVLALMLLLGVGVDYGIFMQESADGRDTTPWLAVGLSAANTILSFGLLGLSRTPALQAFGLTMLVGTALVWLIVPCFSRPAQADHA